MVHTTGTSPQSQRHIDQSTHTHKPSHVHKTNLTRTPALFLDPASHNHRCSKLTAARRALSHEFPITQQTARTSKAQTTQCKTRFWPIILKPLEH